MSSSSRSSSRLVSSSRPWYVSCRHGWSSFVRLLSGVAPAPRFVTYTCYSLESDCVCIEL